MLIIGELIEVRVADFYKGEWRKLKLIVHRVFESSLIRESQVIDKKKDK